MLVTTAFLTVPMTCSCNAVQDRFFYMRRNLTTAASRLGHTQLHLQVPINASERQAAQINWSAFYEIITQPETLLMSAPSLVMENSANA